MKFNAFDLISPAIGDMKKLLFPFSMRKWLRLGFISLMGGGTGGNPNFSGNIGGGGDGGIFSGNSTDSSGSVTGNAVKNVKESLGNWYYLIFPIVIVLIGLGLLMAYITSVFSFIFLEALEKGDVKIKQSWKKHKPLGYSLFLFKLVVGLISLAVILIAATPFALPILQNGFDAYIQNFNALNLTWMIPLLFIVVLFMIAIAIFMALVFHFSVVHSYFKKMPIRRSVKETFHRMKGHKLAVFIFLFARFMINIATAILAVILLVILAIPTAILAIPFAIVLFSLEASLGWSVPLIIIAVVIVVIGIALVSLWIYAFSVAFLPVSTFSRYFSIRNYRALMK